MTDARPITTLTLAALLTLACSAQKDSTEDLADVKQEWEEAGEALSDYGSDRSEEFKARVESRIDEIRDELAELRADGSEQKQELVAALESQLDGLQRSLNELADSGRENWRQARDRVMDGLESAEESFAELVG